MIDGRAGSPVPAAEIAEIITPDRSPRRARSDAPYPSRMSPAKVIEFRKRHLRQSLRDLGVVGRARLPMNHDWNGSVERQFCRPFRGLG